MLGVERGQSAQIVYFGKFGGGGLGVAQQFVKWRDDVLKRMVGIGLDLAQLEGKSQLRSVIFLVARLDQRLGGGQQPLGLRVLGVDRELSVGRGLAEFVADLRRGNLNLVLTLLVSFLRDGGDGAHRDGAKRQHGRQRELRNLLHDQQLSSWAAPRLGETGTLYRGPPRQTSACLSPRRWRCVC